MTLVERHIRFRKVRAEVAPAALAPRQRGMADQARERMPVLGELLEPGGVAHEPGLLPERRARVLRRNEPPAGLGLLPRSGRRGLGARRARYPAAEHEAFAERVRGQTVRTVETRARALADGVEAG